MASEGHVGQQMKSYYHGSPEHLEPGDVIKPTSATGKTPTRGDSDPSKVYVTPHPFVAGQYTWKYDHEGKLADDPDAGPSGHVYEVRPAGRLLNDKNVPHGMKDWSYTAREAQVVRKLDPKEWR